MDLTQIFIVISLLAISTAIVVTTIYLVSLIKELRNAVSKAASILSDAQQITSSVAKPVSSFSEFLMGFKNGFHLFNSFFDNDKRDK